MKYTGGCHCGEVQFEVEASTPLVCHECNCSICSKAGYLHLIVPLSQWRLLRGEESLATYTFGSGIAKHTFCRSCGVKSFYTPRSNPDGVSVNVRCLDPIPASLTIDAFDGQHWEANAQTLAHLSEDSA
ncbi:GFA family protein [Pseudomonadales bacterium]|nr:GFA family protein [Pseudomonadales bacterium]MDB9942320.1 GFA family protein [Pseudomonadales bacterium]MDC1368784.1 GFA family protein [Pseudomonadales bacterium]